LLLLVLNVYPVAPKTPAAELAISSSQRHPSNKERQDISPGDHVAKLEPLEQECK
jgi:hypothetical protein